MATNRVSNQSPQDLNAKLNLWAYDDNGQRYIDFESDKEAARAFFLTEVNPRTRFFYTLQEKLEFLFVNDYYEFPVWGQYGLKIEDGEIAKDHAFKEIKSIYKLVYGAKHRFPTYLGAQKFYAQYAMKDFDGTGWLERFEDRVVANALYLGNGNIEDAKAIAEEIVHGRLQPATPTFSNAGKAQRGKMISCFLLHVEDSMPAIAKVIHNALALSKNGGGVGINLTDIREYGAPIKKIKNQSSGIIPIMKLLEDSFSFANQLGSRQGSGVTYLHVNHPDILRFLDTKRENADEKIRIKTLSAAVIVPDIFFELAKKNSDMSLFSPYDILNEYGKPMSQISITEMYDELAENPNIRKTTVSARKLLTEIAALQAESGYPYIMFEDTVNKANAVDGRISMSNLCVTGDTEILTSDGYRKVSNLYHSQEDFDVVVDTRARDMNFSNSGVSVEKSTKMFKTAEDAEVFKVTTSEGFELTATEWHKMYVHRHGKLIKIPLAEVEIGDKILVQSGGSHTATVTSVEFAGTEDVYDVTVENGNSVIFNGIATGNCSEILQVSAPSVVAEDGSFDVVGRDISCNLASLNIANVLDGGNLEDTVTTAIKALTTVSALSDVDAVPTVVRGNDLTRSVGLGQMNLHGFLIREDIDYGSPLSLKFTNNYFMAVAYYAYKASMEISKETGSPFYEFEKSKYADASYLKEKYSREGMIVSDPELDQLFSKYGISIPTYEDWADLADKIEKHGLYHGYLQAVAPTGSISFVNYSTASIHPITDRVETRKEGMTGRSYFPQPFITNDNFDSVKNAYQIGYESLIDVYAEATKHVDQGLSCTLFMPAGTTTRDLNKAYIYAWKKGLKTLYYTRIQSDNLTAAEQNECVSCAL